jgi:hypothetical protein
MKNIQRTFQVVILFGLVFSLVSGTLHASLVYNRIQTPLQNQQVSQQNIFTDAEEHTVRVTLAFSENDLSFDTLFGYDIVSMNDGSYLNEIGKPMMPVKTFMVALPDGMKATQVRILSLQEQPLVGMYSILPAQPPLPTIQGSGSILSVPPSSMTYMSALPYPGQRVTVGEQTDLAGQGMLPVCVCPLRYLPLQKKLILVQSITVEVEGTEGYICHDYLPQTISDNGSMMYEQMVKGMVINPDAVHLSKSSSAQPLGVPPGDYDYVIITQESWVSAFQPLANWKTKKGVPATIVTTTWIYNSGGYSGTEVQKLRAFVQDAYTTWGTIYVLIGGDIDVVPCHYKTFTSPDNDPVPNDVYYADFDSDWICEVNIGRASVTAPGTGVGQIGNFINKLMTYETNPPLTNYAMNAGFFGFDLDGSTDAELCKVYIKDTYIPTTWTVTTVYDSHTGNHKTNVIAALNAGQNLVNHADHSNNDCMGVGYVNHDLLLYNADMDGLTNGNKQTILYSMGCDPAAYDVSNCIAEHFVRDNNGGGIAFIGNSRYGWYNPGYTNTLSMEYDIRFFRSIFQESLFNLGVAFSDHKNDVIAAHPSDNTYRYIFTELTLLGDPEVPIWTENPTSFVVSHPLSLPAGSSSFTVHVESTTGSDIANAYVCLWKGSEVYQRGYTSSAGDATFTVSPTTAGMLNVTVTKHNYIPSQTTAQVIVGNVPPNQPSSPSPSPNATDVPRSADLSWTGGDPNPSDTVTYDVYFGTSSTPPKIVNNQSATTYDPGLLEYDTRYYWKIIAWDNSHASTSGPIWAFTTTVNFPPVFGTPTPTNGSTWNPLTFTWSMPINDIEGDSFSWSIQCSNGQTNSASGASNGTKTLILTDLSYSITYTVWVNATDLTGSGIYTRGWYTFSTQIDSTPPITTLLFNGTMGSNGWYKSHVYVILTATDNESGVDQIYYRIDNGTWSEYHSPVEISLDGVHVVSYYSIDITGNIETIKTANMSMDHTPPDITVTKEDISLFEYRFTATASDALSGMDRVEFSLDGLLQLTDAEPPYVYTWSGLGDHTVTATAYDLAGNSQSQSVSTPCIYTIQTQSSLLRPTPMPLR